jgi:hypothetical protein
MSCAWGALGWCILALLWWDASAHSTFVRHMEDLFLGLLILGPVGVIGAVAALAGVICANTTRWRLVAGVGILLNVGLTLFFPQL